MYDKYYLSKKQIDCIQTWPINKPLFIHGPSGVGKTSLARDILKNTTLTIIDSIHIKNNENMYNYISNIIQKRNITLMFRETKERGLIIDDLDVFFKHDKKNFKLILNLLETYNYYGAKIIVIFNSNISNNRMISKIDNISINLVHSNQNFFKITENILKENKKQYPFEKIFSLITKSKYNLHDIYSLIEKENKKNNENNEINGLLKDNHDSVEDLYKKIIIEKIDCGEILRLYAMEENIISLNLLENISTYIFDLKKIVQIYRYFELSDIFDIQSIIHHNYEFKNYSCIFKIYNIHYHLKSIQNVIYKPPIYNKYISRSLISIHLYKMRNKYECQYNSVIELYLFCISKRINTKTIIDKLKGFNRKEMDYYIKLFNYFYNFKIKLKDIYT